MASYFISDIHLGLDTQAKERAKEDRLLAFLSAIFPTTDTLLVVGDLFDFWFEYQTVIPKGYHRTLSKLQEFTQSGRPIHYLAGNHDFWMGDFFETELGMTMHRDPFEISLEGKRVFLHHGDGLAANDLGYRLIKPVLRNRVNVWLYRWLHPDIGVRLARGSSRTSRGYTSTKDFGEDEGMTQYAAKIIQQGVDIVVMGHRHKPHLLPTGGGMYVNLGDWITHNTYGRLAGGVMTLNTWNGALAP